MELWIRPAACWFEKKRCFHYFDYSRWIRAVCSLSAALTATFLKENLLKSHQIPVSTLIWKWRSTSHECANTVAATVASLWLTASSQQLAHSRLHPQQGPLSNQRVLHKGSRVYLHQWCRLCGDQITKLKPYFDENGRWSSSSTVC